MTPTARVWVACAAVGAGLLHVATALGRPLEVAAALFVIGLAEFVWGALALAWSRVLVPRIALGLAFVPGVAWLVAIAARVPGIPFLPLALSTVLEFLAAALIAFALRRPREGRPAGAATIAVAALVVAALVLPGLVASRAEVPSGILPPSEHGHR